MRKASHRSWAYAHAWSDRGSYTEHREDCIGVHDCTGSEQGDGESLRAVGREDRGHGALLPAVPRRTAVSAVHGDQ